MILFGAVWIWYLGLGNQWNALSLMGHTCGSMEDGGAESDLMYYPGLDQNVSEEKNFSMLPRNCSCDILVKNVAAFRHCPESLPEAKVKKFWINSVGRGNLKTA